MKMSDVFELPVEVCQTFDDYSCMSVDGLVLLQDQANFGAHAINCHDGLVNAAEVLLLHPELADREAIAELLARAKSDAS